MKRRPLPGSRDAVVARDRAAQRAERAQAPRQDVSHARAAALRAMLDTDDSAASDSQADRMLRAMRETGRVTTFEARTFLDVCEPTARIHHLRHQRGLPVLLTWVRQVSAAGKLHRVGCYVLARGDGPQ